MNKKLNFNFSKQEWEAAVEASYKKNAKDFKIQGFRPGKAPRGVIEKNYGPEVFFEGAIHDLFVEAYKKVLTEDKDFNPIEHPSIDFKFTDEGGINIEASVDTLPNFELGKYKGLEVKKDKANVDDKEVDNYLERVQKSRARQVKAEAGHKIQKGDIVNIDFAGSIDGVNFEGGTASGHELEIGSNSFIDTFEDQLIGKKIGDETDVKVTFPVNYHAKNLAGQPAKFAVKINEIKKSELPALDDTFASEVSEFKTLAEYKADIKKNLTSQAEFEIERINDEKLLDAVVDQTKLTPPRSMIDRQTDMANYDMEYRLSQSGLTMEMYANFMNMTMDEFNKKQSTQAARTVKTRLVLDKIAEAEKITVTESEIDAEIKRLAQSTGRKEADYKKNRDRIAYIEENLRFTKVIDFLKSNNKFV